MNCYKTLLTGLVILLALYTTMLMLTYNSFDANGFNMTDELIEEERLLETCMKLNIKSDECNMIYGNTNNSVDDGRID